MSTEIKAGQFNVKLTAFHNKKFQCAVIFINFTTTEKELLSMLLQKYKQEKCLKCGLNMNNCMYNCITGEQSIAIFAPENKIPQNIILLLQYLSKTKLSSLQAKLVKTCDYDKLQRDLKDIDITITGKCKNFVAAVTNKAPKIDRLKESIAAISPTKRDKVSDDKHGFTPYTVNLNNLTGCQSDAMMYLAIVLGDIPCTFKKNGTDGITVTFLDPCMDARVFQYSVQQWRDVMQARVKAFLVQSGSVGSPSANDTGKVKWNAKVDNIMKCQNMLADIYARVHGFTYKFANSDALKKVNSEAMNKVRGIK